MRAGGAERMTFILANSFAKRGYNVVLCVVDYSNPFFIIKNKDIEVIDLKINHSGKSFFKLIQVINSYKPDKVISMVTHLNTVVGLAFPFFKGKPKVYLRETNVLNNLYSKQMSIRRYARFILNKIAYTKVDGIICQSAFMKEDVVSTLNIDSSKCTVIHNPVLPPQSGSKDHNFDIVALGNLSEVKGYLRLLEVMIVLSKHGITLGIIGEGSQRVLMESFIRENNLNDNVYLLGQKSNPNEYLVGTKALVMTSIYESFPNAVLEAGILGVPTIAYEVPGGLKYIIKNGINGFLIENNNVTQFCSKVLQLIEEPLSKNVIINYVKKNFSIDVIMKEYLKLLSV